MIVSFLTGKQPDCNFVIEALDVIVLSSVEIGTLITTAIATDSLVPFPQGTVFNDPANVANVFRTNNCSGVGETVGINEHRTLIATIDAKARR